MFTGLIQCKGVLRSVKPRGSGALFSVQAPGLISDSDPLKLGESIAVNGVCLTVASVLPDGFTADVLEETLRCTMFGWLSAGSAVNLERALRFGDRLGGHLVSGHVDEVGRLIDIRPEGNDFVYRFTCSERFASHTVRKGSVAVSGTSLTVTSVGCDWFEVSLIPTTRRDTVLGTLSPGAYVNLESDMIGAYVRKALGQTDRTLEDFIAAGFAD